MDSHRLHALKAFDDTQAGVKGLVDAGVTAIPSIFRHRPESLLPCSAATGVTIPVIDLAPGAAAARADLVAQVKAAAQTAGFFQVVNHGVPETAMSAMLAAVKRFNEEPAEAKRAYYTRDAARRVRFQSNFDLFQSPAANWRDTLLIDMAPEPPAPEEIPPACRAVLFEYTGRVHSLARNLFELLSEALGGVGGCALDTMNFAGHYYPACPEPHLTLGTTSHSDPGYLTVLLQDAVGGLQVLLDGLGKEKAWVEVPAVAGALVVNIGDYLQLVSNDMFRSVEHRVVASSVGPRISVACFFRPADTTVLRPIVSDDGEEARYRSATVEELTTHYRLKGLDGTSALRHFRL
ncbi:1-aminocyclopropane-1-carboxylate oxidase homolog 1 [Brachypodium distachyon]|uniref:Fe2OG dioxygenase domain-containing protein n=1 Tax=Brachypodium distachyon TaxID=15368 RepID=I1IX14_BRADI|nr:1-aminocyclopropane-1-carboxylate oxidase homolog 1 [Brachypodium distachyon]KQJ82248.1 hypothetical protein BRADI_5g07760v3 [Brachypodium distachyon]|eukprot:XP_024312159.1 1-aminocyclopropane-1-carboxylate oxidase homolog 1 [Brachypodium distachyon]